MAKLLQVFLNQFCVGTLTQKVSGMSFKYSADWLTSLACMPLSLSLPLQEATFSYKACRGFFEGILPEENARILIAKNKGVSANNEFSLLEKLGGECAGAVTLLPKGEFPQL